MLVICDKEWARDPSVLQPCTVLQAAFIQAMRKLQFSQPPFTTHCTSAAALLRDLSAVGFCKPGRRGSTLHFGSQQQ